MLTSTMPYGHYRGIKPTHAFQLLVLRGIALLGIRGKRPFSSKQWNQRNNKTRTICMAPRLRSASQLKSLRSCNNAAQDAYAWDRLLQGIHEEVLNNILRNLPMGRARADSRAQILKETGLFEGGPEIGGGGGAGMATRHRVDHR